MPGAIAITQSEVQEFMRLIASDLASQLIERNAIPTQVIRDKVERLQEFADFYDYHKRVRPCSRPHEETVTMNLDDNEIKTLMKKSAKELLANLEGGGYRGNTKDQVDRLVVLQANLAAYKPPAEEG